MTTLVVLGSIVAYFVLGAFYARSQALACHARAKERWGYEEIVATSVKEQMFWRALAWPYAVPFDLIRGGLGGWFMAPITSRKDRAEQLRADAAAWRAKRYDGTPAEQAMADELARLCDEQAREIDL